MITPVFGHMQHHNQKVLSLLTQQCMNRPNTSCHVRFLLFLSLHMFCSVHRAILHSLVVNGESERTKLFCLALCKVLDTCLHRMSQQVSGQPEQPLSALLHNSKWSSDPHEENTIDRTLPITDSQHNTSQINYMHKFIQIVQKNRLPFEK